MLQGLLRPKSIAIVGASETEHSFGRRLMNSVISAGFTGDIYAVNPKRDTILGKPSFPSLTAIGEQVDLVVFGISEDRLVAGFEEAAKIGVKGALVYSRGYTAPDEPGPSIGERWAAIAREARIAVCGDNCMGFINFIDKVRASANPPPVEILPGSIGFITHSGSTWSGVVGSQRQLKFNYAISAGREVTTSMADYIEFLLDQPETKVIGLILEMIRNPDKFVEVIRRARSRNIPVVALKLGRSERGRHFTQSHSGAVAGSDAAYQALFEEHGVIRVKSMDDLTDTLEIMSCDRRPTTGAVAIGTDSGGERQLLSDIGTDVGIKFAAFSKETVAKLESVLDPGLEAANPLDYWGDGRLYFRECLEIMADDDGVGALIMATNMVGGRRTLTLSSEAIEAVHRYTKKPVLMMSNLHSSIDRPEAMRLRSLGIPVLMGTETGLSAVKSFLKYHNSKGEVPGKLVAPPAPKTVAFWREQLADRKGQALAPVEAEKLLRDFGISAQPSGFSSNLQQALNLAEDLGYPVALKTACADILHKSDLGGVLLNLRNSSEVSEAYRKLSDKFGSEVQVQEMAKPGLELLLGMTTDEQLGPMVTVGLGGIFVEILKDVTTFVPPVSPERALTILKRLKGFPLLAGSRGKKPVDLNQVSLTIARFSVLAHSLSTALAEADLNPLIAREDGVSAVDALFIGKKN